MQRCYMLAGSKPDGLNPMEHATIAVLATAFASFVVAEVLVLTAGRHGRFSMDRPGAIQKFHSRPTPRIGGVALALLLPIFTISRVMAQ